MKGYSQRLVYISIIALLITYVSAIALLLLSCGGCAIAMKLNDGVGSHLHVYEPFDNAHDWGPNYLVGPSSHYLSNASRVDELSILTEKPTPTQVKPSQPLPALSHDETSAIQCSSARKVVGRYSPEEIYSSKREQIEREIREEGSHKLEGKHVQVNAVLIREVHLPAAVQAAIQTKLEEEQKALQMQFVLERTRQEAVRKHIEALGIADYQAIISKGLNDQVIEWKGIEATEKLAESPNSKVIIVGSGKNGLPVILNTGSAGAVSPPVANR
jgi:SPFH domain / Band 7 family